MNAATALGGRSTSLAEPHNLSEITSELMLLPLDAKFPRNGNTFISDYLVQCRCIQSWQYHWAALSSRGHCWVSILPTQLKCIWSEISFVGRTSSSFRNLEKCGLKYCSWKVSINLDMIFTIMVQAVWRVGGPSVAQAAGPNPLWQLNGALIFLIVMHNQAL